MGHYVTIHVETFFNQVSSKFNSVGNYVTCNKLKLSSRKMLHRMGLAVETRKLQELAYFHTNNS